MLTVTETLLEKFDKAISRADESDAADKCIRLVKAKHEGLALKLEKPAEDDTTYEYDGRTVLAIPENCVQLCVDRTMDINEDGEVVLA